MADNTVLSVGAGGDTIATDDIGGVKHQRVKVQHGADGAATDVSSASPLPVSVLNFASRSDTFTVAASGTTVDITARPLKCFSIQVKGTGAAPTSWTVLLEGSLDGVNFSTILTHTNTVNSDGTVAFCSAVLTPARYFRSRCTAVVLGGASDIVATILGMN